MPSLILEPVSEPNAVLAFMSVKAAAAAVPVVMKSRLLTGPLFSASFLSISFSPEGDEFRVS
jgi:hypothetical protein